MKTPVPKSLFHKTAGWKLKAYNFIEKRLQNTENKKHIFWRTSPKDCCWEYWKMNVGKNVGFSAEYWKKNINPFQPSVAFHIETSHLVCTENRMTGFYMKCNIGLNWVEKNIVEKWTKVTVTILFITTFQKEITLKNRLKGCSTKK